MSTSARLEALSARLSRLGSVVVAFSGGADSVFLAAAAHRTLGPANVLAVTAVSASLPAVERTAAVRVAAAVGVPHRLVDTHEERRAGYRDNGGDRCYFCKSELIEVLREVAKAEGLAAVATGTNADDVVAGFRPGIRAAAERGAVTPLRDAGLTKADVRALSREWQLPTWDKPAAACLASRIAYGVTVTSWRLARVERAEDELRTAIFSSGAKVRHLRVRDLGDHASVEVDAGLVGWLTARQSVLSAVTGFESVVVDPRGFRSGSMNEHLADPERFR